jgi:DNA (cytosine-5)-methyltransferase 1
MAPLRHLDLFSGIGGFALAAQWVGGIKTTQFVEIDPYCQKVLAKNFPGVPVHDDIRSFTANAGDYDLLTAGFPCQPHSTAGTRKASKDDRDLWPELYRIICEVRSKWIVLENVRGLLSSESGRFFKRILWQLTTAGYDAEWGIVSCSDLGGSHRRERIWIVAYPHSFGRQRSKTRESVHDFKWHYPSSFQEWRTEFHEIEPSGAIAANADSTGLEARQWESIKQSPISQLKRHNGGKDRMFETEPTICRGNDGVPDRMDRIRALGNAIVPQVAMIPLQRILDLELESNKQED